MVTGMSNDEPNLYEGREIPQFGTDIKEPGEPFGDETLDVIRALVTDDDVVPGTPATAAAPAPRMASREEHVSDAGDTDAQTWNPVGERAKAQASAADWHEWVEAPRRREWRRLEIVEGGPGRALRRFLTTPRLLSIAFLSGVVYWYPMFIPMLVLVVVSVLLLIGALIGQDRMGRFVGRRIQRLIWRDPAMAALIEKITPRRWRHLLYRPTSEEASWDGPIDPSFAQRLSRIRA